MLVTMAMPALAAYTALATVFVAMALVRATSTACVVAKPLVIVVVGRPLVTASVAAANVLLVEVSRFVDANPFAALIVSKPLVIAVVGRPLVILPLTKPLVNAPAALIVSRPLVIAVVGRPLVMASVAVANVLLVEIRRFVDANAPAALIVSRPLVMTSVA